MNEEISSLLKGLEKEIWMNNSDIFSLIEKSENRQELFEQGPAILTEILIFIKHRPSASPRVELAWGYMLSLFDKDVIHSDNAPTSISPLQPWIRWADSHKKDH